MSEHPGDRVQGLFDQAVALPPEQRAAFLEAACAGDPGLQAEKPHLAEIVLLRYYTGLSVEETADVVGRSVSTVTREWRFARAWLAERLGGGAAPGGEEGADDGGAG